MDIENPPGPPAGKVRAENAHKARQDKQFHAVVGQCLGNGRFKSRLASQCLSAAHHSGNPGLGSPDGPTCNAAMGQEALRRWCALDPEGQALMKGAYEHMGLTARSYDRILRVARTIADLDGAAAILAHHLAEAIQYRESDYFAS